MSLVAQDEEKRSFIKGIFSSIKSKQNACAKCFSKYKFSKLSGFTRTCLPPIGSGYKGQILFVGTNPRCNMGTEDEDFYRYALSSERNFVQFSTDGKYLDSYGNPKFLFNDPYYDLYKQCLWKVDGSWSLGVKSSAAELFMCGSKDANIFYRDKPNNLYKKYSLDRYICAEQYFVNYLKLVKPKVIVSVGWIPMQWFQARFRDKLMKNTYRINQGNVKKYYGSPERDIITDLHGCFCKIQVDGEPTTVIFSLHPNARDFSPQKRNELLNSFAIALRN
jgi:uracil-DNA glycosylase